jgi:hypothetical protein
MLKEQQFEPRAFALGLEAGEAARIQVLHTKKAYAKPHAIKVNSGAGREHSSADTCTSRSM